MRATTAEYQRLLRVYSHDPHDAAIVEVLRAAQVEEKALDRV
jgi:hypothetical protein